MTDLRERLQSALEGTYRIEKELGGGGMSRVFLANETALGRNVVIKVLPPEMAAAVNVDRFRREIQLAASLQHPHIVPLHAAGQAGDLFFYTMPLVEGESLRAKLVREGELPVTDSVRILRDVADALAYAHQHGVVHRDIKPDNVLISGQHALVTDFGVAKAVSAASDSSALTSLGVALGTPAYMAPEQAAGDPHLDHRADLYATGALAYEMLTGRPPFIGSPQSLLAAQVTQAPDPVVVHRPAVPAGLNLLVMRCLEKKPADRVQRAEELLAQLEAMATPTGGLTPTGAAVISSGSEAALRRTHPVRVTLLFAAAALGVLGLIALFSAVVGLPRWVLPGSIVLLIVGLPIMLLTSRIERRRALARTGGATVPTPGGVGGVFTWRKSLLGGAAAFGALGLGTAAYMTMRALGIGPVGTLVASGALHDRQRVILADFVNRSADTTLGPTLTEAFRVDLAQSPSVKLLDGRSVADALRRMQRDPAARLTPDLAREVAEREGVSAVVTGEIDPVDKGFVLSASVISAVDGHVLTAVRATASDGSQLIGALDKVSNQLRERIGDSFKSLSAAIPLDQVTTASLEALRRYSQAVRVSEQGDWERAISLLQEATALDTAFAMAYRKLAVALNNTGGSADQAMAAAAHAYALRDRLTPRERWLATAYYYRAVDFDPKQQELAYRGALELDPNDDVALNNLALALIRQRRWHEAESLALRGIDLGYTGVYYGNAITAQAFQGHWAAAETTAARYDRAFPGNPDALGTHVSIASGQRDYAAAERFALQLRKEQQASLQYREQTNFALAALMQVQGRMQERDGYGRLALEAEETRGLRGNYIGNVIGMALGDLVLRNRRAEALAHVAAALERHPLASIAPVERPYLWLAQFYARAGRPEESRRLMTEYEREVPAISRNGDASEIHATQASIAVSEGRFQDAIVTYRLRIDEPHGCIACSLFELGEAYDRAGQADSALALYERFVTVPALFRLPLDAIFLPAAYKRIAELYEAKGDRQRALDYYGRFVDLWKGADAELQPIVREVQQRITHLGGER